MNLPEPAPVDERTLSERFLDTNAQLGKDLTTGFNRMSEGVVKGYKAIETGVVKGYTAIEDGFVEQFLTREGETVAEAKARLNGKAA